MPQTIDKTFHGQIIGGTFSSRENADMAVVAFQELGVLKQDIQIIAQPTGEGKPAKYTEILTERGFAGSQAKYYDEAIRSGKVLVAVSGVTDPAPVVDIFDEYKAEYNPDGSRNVRDDVVGLTAGAAAGAAAGGVAGAVVGGPIGGAIGAAAGAVVGGSAGAAVGKATEHRK